jgi:hypothetical protein
MGIVEEKKRRARMDEPIHLQVGTFGTRTSKLVYN